MIRHKFRAIPTTVDNIRFSSKKEAKRYQELKILEKAGAVSDLRLQVPYELAVNGMKICKYVADFVYQGWDYDDKTWFTVIEDCKGYKTPEYKLKAKLMKAVHGIEILET